MVPWQTSTKALSLKCSPLTHPERGIPEHRVIKVEERVGRNQIPVSVLRKAQKLIVEKLLTKFDTVREALRFIDTDGSGTIDREEIKEMLKRFNILEYTDFYTGMKRGDISEEVLDTFVEVCQGLSLSSGDGDTRVETDEFTKVMSSPAGSLLPRSPTRFGTAASSL